MTHALWLTLAFKGWHLLQKNSQMKWIGRNEMNETHARCHASCHSCQWPHHYRCHSLHLSYLRPAFHSSSQILIHMSNFKSKLNNRKRIDWKRSTTTRFWSGCSSGPTAALFFARVRSGYAHHTIPEDFSHTTKYQELSSIVPSNSSTYYTAQNRPHSPRPTSKSPLQSLLSATKNLKSTHRFI